MFENLDLLTEDTDDYSRSLDVRSAISALPEIYRVPINYLICGYKYDEIARMSLRKTFEYLSKIERGDEEAMREVEQRYVRYVLEEIL